MAGIIISPSTENKIRGRCRIGGNRNAALRFRDGLPEFKDVLRQRFRRRIKESRSKLVDKLREVDSINGLRLALKQELSDIVSKMDHGSEVETHSAMDGIEESFTEQEEAIFHHYNLLLSDDDVLQQLYEESMQVVCPICCKGNLQVNTLFSTIQCSACTLRLPARATLQEISVHLDYSVCAHEESGCVEPLRFFISEEDSFVYLYAVCSSCSFLNLVL